jgi:hypothetical protein
MPGGIAVQLAERHGAGEQRPAPPAPRPIADEAADGLIEAYEQHRAAGTGDQEAARAALAEFGELGLVVGEYTRQAPGRRAARLLLATGPAAGLCWALALITGRAWTWPVPATARLGFGAALLLTAALLLAAATSRHSYHRTRLTAAASPLLLAPGRDSGGSRRARRARPAPRAGRRRGRQPQPDRLHRLGASPPHRPLSTAAEQQPLSSGRPAPAARRRSS